MDDITLLQGDCLVHLKDIPDRSVDLIVTDPPYLIANTRPGGKSELARSMQGINNEIRDRNLDKGFNQKVLDGMFRVMKKPNIYIWCNKAQITGYLDYFVNQKKCGFDILVWQKTNALPTFNNKYLTDKEYCLYFRKGGYCQPGCYEDAKTVFLQPINQRDRKAYGHPTIKPLGIIETLVRNSSREGDTVLDPFMGSGTTGVACKNLKRKFIGMELEEEYFKLSEDRIYGRITAPVPDKRKKKEEPCFKQMDFSDFGIGLME